MGRRPPARLTASLLGSSHLGQLFTSTAPSLDPFLVKIKNLGSKTPKSQPLLPPSMDNTGLNQMWPPPLCSNPNLNPQLVINKSGKVSKNREAKAQRNNLIKTAREKWKEKERRGRRWVRGQKLPSGRKVKIKSWPFNFDLDWRRPLLTTWPAACFKVQEATWIWLDICLITTDFDWTSSCTLKQQLTDLNNPWF